MTLSSVDPGMSVRKRRECYFTFLRDAMESEHGWKSCAEGNSVFPRSCRFQPAGNLEPFWNVHRPECSYRAWFPKDDKEIVAGLLIRESHLFDAIHGLKAEIESDFGGALDWSQRLCRNPGTQKRKFIFASRRGSIQSTLRELQEMCEWHVETLLKLDEVFTPSIQRLRSEIEL